MSFGKKCERYLKKRNQRVRHLLDKIPSGYEKENFHELRVEIKKTKALVNLAAHVIGIDQKKFLKPYQEIFKVAGLTRDVQVAEDLLRKVRPLKWVLQYREELRIEAEQREKEFYLAVNERVQRERVRSQKKMDSWVRKIKKDAATEFLLRERRKIYKLIRSGPIQVEHAHRLRKKLKRIGYVERLVKGRDGTHSGALERIKEDLGVWHDNRELAARLRRDAARQRDKQRKLHMRNLEKEIDSRAKKMLIKIGHSLKTFDKIK